MGRFAMAGRFVRSAVGLCVVGFCRLLFSWLLFFLKSVGRASWLFVKQPHLNTSPL